MTRKSQIEERIRNKELQFLTVQCKYSYIAGAEWADANNPYKQLCFEMYTQLVWIRNLSDQCSVTHNDLISLYEALKSD